MACARVGADRLPVAMLCPESRRPASGLHAVPGVAESVRLQRHGARTDRSALPVGLWRLFAYSGNPGGPLVSGEAGGGELFIVERVHDAVGLRAEWYRAVDLPRSTRRVGVLLHARG